MPRYYCDYCDTYLTHDSPSVRKQHNAGYKHKANVRSYYQQFEEQQTQSFIDQRIKEHLGQTAAFQQVGAAYNQHLASFPGNPPRPRLAILPTPVMPMSGAIPSQPVPGIRLPVLPRPSAPAYGSVPMMAPNVGPPVAPLLSSRQENGLPRPPMINMPTAPSAGSGAPNSNEPLPTFTQAMYQTNPSAPGSTAPSATTSVETFSYAQQSEDGH